MKDLMVLLADGFEDIEALTVVDFLRRGGLEVDTVSVTAHNTVTTAHDVKIFTDLTLDDIKLDDYKALYIPGGSAGAATLADNHKVREMVELYNGLEKLVFAMCAGPVVLDKANVLKNRKFTCYPGVEQRMSDGLVPEDQALVEDDNIITARGPAYSAALAFKMIERLRDENAAKDVKKATLYDELGGTLSSL
ncbi:DJ-1/PfpI family protein [Peptoniphilus equinus]|uniref:DJ-1/PfpI family protein n=1 Tax=Peptoniphilus equinus TaxID=3016343 RepID=A0ABY7QU80_9FIRM|nr:DJ-1 family glyoxalase III [Peptoniphilus equinus]WBW50006.1 DJ-1/PfpI family protein [Peptoniphilus equinus]